MQAALPFGGGTLFRIQNKVAVELQQAQVLTHTVGEISSFGRAGGIVNLQLMRAIIDGFPFATLVVNSAGNVDCWNKTSEQMFGWKSSEVMGRSSPIVPRDRQDESRAFQELVLNGRTLLAKSLRQRQEGALIEVNATMVPLRNGSGVINHILILHEPASEPVFLTARTAELVAGDAHRSGDNGIEEPLSAALGRFTPRQREIIMLVARGCSNREIAKSLSMGEQQVKNYLRGIYREIRVANRTELVVWLNEQRQREQLLTQPANNVAANVICQLG
ncbi:MAG: domain S-box protein [Acidobacteriaceae bacterium]|nr:domain S-box protein [Acidobacteriaceae bacterium]